MAEAGRDPRAIVLAVLATTPRYYRDGRRVRTSTWNTRAADTVVRALADGGWLPPPVEPPRWTGPADAAEEKTVGAARIIAVVAAQFDVDPAALTGAGQERRVSVPRHVAMYLCRAQLGLSFPEIGRLFDRDHSTVMHAVRQIVTALRDNPHRRRQIDVCRQELAGGLAGAA
jgi:hypothetical protein